MLHLVQFVHSGWVDTAVFAAGLFPFPGFAAWQMTEGHVCAVQTLINDTVLDAAPYCYYQAAGGKNHRPNLQAPLNVRLPHPESMTAQRATEQMVDGNGQALALNPSFAPCSGGKGHGTIFCRDVCSTVVGDRLCRTLMTTSCPLRIAL